MANRSIELDLTGGLNSLLDFFDKAEGEITLQELKSKSFVLQKQDLNMMLYTSQEKGFLKQTKKKPPIWKKKEDIELTDELRKDISDEVNYKLSKRKPETPKSPPSSQSQSVNLQIFAENVQIGNHNILNCLNNQELQE